MTRFSIGRKTLKKSYLEILVRFVWKSAGKVSWKCRTSTDKCRGAFWFRFPNLESKKQANKNQRNQQQEKKRRLMQSSRRGGAAGGGGMRQNGGMRTSQNGQRRGQGGRGQGGRNDYKRSNPRYNNNNNNATTTPPHTNSPPQDDNTSLQQHPSDPVIGGDSPLSSTPLSMKERMVWMMSVLIGQTVSVELKDGTTYNGIFHTSSISNPPTQKKRGWGTTASSAPTDEGLSIVLKMAKKETKEEDSILKKPLDILTIPHSSLSSLSVLDIRCKGETAQGRGDGSMGGFVVDGMMSGGSRDRELVAWKAPEGDDGMSFGLEEKKGRGMGWNQFDVNRELFGVESSFQEEIYTTPLDRDSQVYKDRSTMAEKIASEIHSESSSNVHLKEERGQKIGDDYDEETLYSGVVREEEKEEKKEEETKEGEGEKKEEKEEEKEEDDMEEKREDDKKDDKKKMSLGMRADAEDFNPFDMEILDSLPSTHTPSSLPPTSHLPSIDPSLPFSPDSHNFSYPGYPAGGEFPGASGVSRHPASPAGAPPIRLHPTQMQAPPMMVAAAPPPMMVAAAPPPSYPIHGGYPPAPFPQQQPLPGSPTTGGSGGATGGSGFTPPRSPSSPMTPSMMYGGGAGGAASGGAAGGAAAGGYSPAGAPRMGYGGYGYGQGGER